MHIRKDVYRSFRRPVQHSAGRDALAIGSRWDGAHPRSIARNIRAGSSSAETAQAFRSAKGYGV